MTKRLRKKQILLACAALSAAAVFGTAFGAMTGAFAADSAPAVAEAEVADTYFTGTAFTPPAAVISYGGETKEAERTTLLYPSGGARSASSYTLDEAGMYTLVYSADFGGVPVEERRTFVAVQHLFEVNGSGSAYYGTDERVPGRPGIVAELRRGDSFEFNRIIDFNELNAEDGFIDLYVIPEEEGAADALQLIFTLTDTENPDNYITITAQQADVDASVTWARRSIYTRAGAAFQPQSGWESRSTGDVLHSGDTWGTPTNFSLYGDCANGETFATQTYRLWFDYAAKTVYVGPNMTEVIRLDDPAAFSQFWDGFEEGTAYLSVSCGLYNSASATVVFTDIAGFDLTGGNDEEVRDENAPELAVEVPETIPQAVVGVPYPVFAASASDDRDDSPRLSCRVWYNYGGSTASEYTVREGAFTPDRAGRYVIEYTAVDSFGNESKETYTVVAGERETPLSIVPNAAEGEGFSGEDVAVGGYAVSGAIGGYSVTARAALEGSDVVCEVVGLTETGGTFFPEYAGTYLVTYTVTDYISSATATCRVEVEAGENVRISAVPELPSYLIVGCTYDLSGALAYEYSSGVPAATGVTISCSSAADISGTSFTPTAAGGMTIVFRAEGAGGSYDEISVPVQAVDVGYGGDLAMGSWFFGNGVTSAAQQGYVSLNASADARFDFINALDANFSLQAGIDSSRNAFGELAFAFADAESGEVGIEISILKNAAGENAVVLVNGRTAGSFEGDWYDDSSFTISYDNSTGMLSVGSVLTVDMTSSAYGFGGFPSDRIRLSGAFAEVTGEAGLRFYRVNNQTLNNRAYDVATPQVTLLGNMDRSFTPGEKVTVVPAIATDVLDPNVTFSLTVTSPDGQTVVSEDGVSLSGVDPTRAYSFTADQIGVYAVRWQARDSSGNLQSSSLSLMVKDGQAPSIAFPEGSVREGSVGSAVPVAAVSVSDDFDEDVAYYVYLTRPDGVMLPLYTFATDGSVLFFDGFVPDVAGEWTVTYYAADDTGNAAVESYVVTVR